MATGSTQKPDAYKLPDDPEVERRVLGAILLDPKAVFVAFKYLQPDDFTSNAHKHVFRAAVDLAMDDIEVDCITVGDALQKRKHLDEVGGRGALTRLLDESATSAQIEHHCAILRDRRQRRLLLGVARQIADSRAANSPALLAEVDTKLAKVREQVQRFSDKPPPIITAGRAREFLGDIRWLWGGWIPFGMLSMVVGIGGIGKSAFALALARVLMQQESVWPDAQKFQTNGKPPCVIWLDTEGTHPILTDRITRWGVPDDAIFWPGDPARPDDLFPEFKILNPVHWDRLVRLVETRKPLLIVIDSLRGAFTGDENSSDACQANLDPLAALARQYGCAIILVHHLNKGEVLGHVGDKLDPSRIRGNTTIFNMCRSIIGLDTPSPEARDHMRAYVIKSNVIQIPDKEIGFRFEQAGPVWCEPPTPPERPLTATERAREFLEAHLQTEPRKVDDIKAAAAADGISWRSIERAKQDMEIVKRKVGSVYMWSLPSPHEPEPEPEQGEWWQD